MKKLVLSWLAVCLVCALLSACQGKKQPAMSEEMEGILDIDTPPEIEEPAEPGADELFYEAMKASSSRPIAVMIDNDADYTGPQAGLENAYLIYEMYVEGGSTRMMALYRGDMMDEAAKAERIGPVRSSRHYFLDFALEHDAVYAHCGFSPRAQSEIASRGVNNINGLYESAPFARYTAYNNTWHNLYTAYDKLETSATGHGYRLESDVKMEYASRFTAPEAGTEATHVSIPYSNYTMGYTYDSDSRLYFREKRGSAHVMQSGVQLAAMNVLILRMSNVPLNDGEGKDRQELYDTGSGEGVYITGGRAQAIEWRRSDRSAKTEYFLNGEKLLLNPGPTFIQIVPPSMQVTIE